MISPISLLCSDLHSSESKRLSGWLTTFLVDKITLVAQEFPSLLLINSIIFSNFHNPRGKSSFSWTTSPTCSVYFPLTRDDFNFKFDFFAKFSRWSIFQIFQNYSKSLSPFFQTFHNIFFWWWLVWFIIWIISFVIIFDC